MKESDENLVFVHIDYGRNKDRGDGMKPHAVQVGDKQPTMEDEDSLLKTLKSLVSKNKHVVVFIEQSVHYKLANKIKEIGVDLRLVNQFEVHTVMAARAIPNTDDLKAAEIIGEIGRQLYLSTNGAEPRAYQEMPKWLVDLRIAYRIYADITKLNTSLKLRLGGANKDTGQWTSPNATIEAILAHNEEAKKVAAKALGRMLKENGARDLFTDIKGVGEIAPAFWMTTRPWRFPALSGYLKYAGYRSDVGDSYNHDFGGIMYVVTGGMLKANDPTYVPIYREIKARFIKEHEAFGPHKCGFKTNGTCNKADAKAKNRMATFLLKEVWRRLNRDSEWFRLHGEGL